MKIIIAVLLIGSIPFICVGQEMVIDFSTKKIIISEDEIPITNDLNVNIELPFSQATLEFKNPDQRNSGFKIHKVDLSNPISMPTEITIDFGSIGLLTDHSNEKNLLITFGPNSQLTLINGIAEANEPDENEQSIRINSDLVCNTPGFVYPYMIQPDEVSDFLLVLDFERNKEILKRYRNDKWKTLKNTITSNRTLELKVINKAKNEEFDNISHDISYQTLFLEDGERFRTLLRGGSDEDEGDAAEPTDDDEVGEEEETAELTSEKFINALAVLKKDLEDYHSFIYEYYPDQDRFDNDYAQIKKNVSNCFGIDQLVINPFIVELTRLASDENETNDNIALIAKYFRALEDYQIYSPEFIKVQNADQMSVKIDFKKDETTDPISSEVFNYKLRGGFKIDFSTGLFYSTLKNSQFTTVDGEDGTNNMGTPDDTSDDETFLQKRIVQESENDNSVGVGILTHIYPKLTGGINLGGTLGFMVKDDAIAQFATGLSLLLPVFNDQRIVITGGGIYGEQNKLRSKYTLDEVVPASELENVSDDQLTISDNDWGWFLAISWNFGSLNVGRK